MNIETSAAAASTNNEDKQHKMSTITMVSMSIALLVLCLIVDAVGNRLLTVRNDLEVKNAEMRLEVRMMKMRMNEMSSKVRSLERVAIAESRVIQELISQHNLPVETQEGCASE